MTGIRDSELQEAAMLTLNMHSVSSNWRARILMLAVALAIAGVTTVEFARAQASGARGAATDAATTLKDQTELAVTVYNSDLALVRDVRKLELPTAPFVCDLKTWPRPSIRSPCICGR
jgi:hypothetical protein